MNRFLRKFQPLRDARRMLSWRARQHDIHDFHAVDVGQKAVIAGWRSAHAAGVVLPFADVGFQVRSSEEEDGLLLYIFTLAGTTNRVVVEISAQDGRACMASNLILHHRWDGFLYDGDPIWTEAGRRFFMKHPATLDLPPFIGNHWFTAENVDPLLAADGVPAEIDLLSLDIDGMDLHIWKAIKRVSPRVLIAEFNNAVPSDLALTVPYDPAFSFANNPPGQELYRSASLAAYVAVCRERGYRLVAMNRRGYNAIFLRHDVGVGIFPEIPVTALDALSFPRQMRERHWPAIRDLKWETVG